LNWLRQVATQDEVLALNQQVRHVPDRHHHAITTHPHTQQMHTIRALPLLLAMLAGSVHAIEPATATGQAAAPASAPANPPAAAASPAATPATPALPSQAAPPAREPAATVAGSPGSIASFLQVMFGLLAVLGLLAGVLWALKRVGGGRLAAGSVVKVIGGVPVGNRERVMVVEVADQWIVIGVAPGQVSTLASMPRQEQQAPNAVSGAPDLSAWLKQTVERRNVN
jgi:flagellar protein FliO/FliZ